ncbi:hypothetical protein IFO70_35415 [Phormidium tenue FACHB-886]|nr:hypothetical protein [Phormidium tenue FACHB-886]
MYQIPSQRFPVSQLMQRYQLAKSGIYKRIKGLGILSFRVAGKAYITLEQLQLLDELHQFIQEKGTLAEFVERRQIVSADAIPPTASNRFVTSPSSAPVLHVLSIEPDLLEYFEKLERAALKQWQLSTSEVAALLKLSVAHIHQQGEEFCEAGFLFTQVGQRSMGEPAWKVSKLDPYQV